MAHCEEHTGGKMDGALTLNTQIHKTQTEDGRRAARDIVQFVAFKECRNQEELAEQVRLADYMIVCS